MKQAIMKVLHNVDPKCLPDLEAEIKAAVGDLSGIGVFGQEILVAPFLHPPMSKGGIYTGASESVYDDKWQSKTFMILKLGDDVEQTAKARKKHVPVAGKWYWGFPTEHRHISIMGKGGKNREPINGNPYRMFDGWPCRTVLLADIMGPVERPWEVM